MKKITGALGKVISGPKWKPKDYNDLLCLLFLLTKTMKSKGVIALEATSRSRKSPRSSRAIPR